MANLSPPGSSAPMPGAGRVQLPAVPVLVLWRGQAISLDPDGEIQELDQAAAADLFLRAKPIVCHGPLTARRLGKPAPMKGDVHDILELWAFVRPARFLTPTPVGLAEALGRPPPQDGEEAAMLLVQATALLLQELADPGRKDRPFAQRTGLAMARAGWSWGTAVVTATGTPERAENPRAGLDVWNRLPEWDDAPPDPPPSSFPVPGDAARERLVALLGDGAEARPAQMDYAALAALAFAPRDAAGAPHVVLGEAGTGIGKTLGYVAPASLWAERNGGTVWLSTYTKNLQRQLDQELNRLYPDPSEKARSAVLRKGRENYLCLLNFEEAVREGRDAVALGLIARWAAESRDGDVIGGDFPTFLGSLGAAQPGAQGGLTDRRGECIHSACPHFRKCFIERGQRRARKARLVIANHALVMIQAALRQAAPAAAEDAPEDGDRPIRIVFDEGHHVFDAADSAFAAELTGVEAADLRRWVRGPEGRARRGRGLRERMEDLLSARKAGEEALEISLRAASILPSDGWAARIAGGTPQGPAEQFFARARAQVEARATRGEDGFDREAGTEEPVPGLVEAAAIFADGLDRLREGLRAISADLAKRLDDEAEELETQTRARIDAARRGIARRTELLLPAWVGMLRNLGKPVPEGFVDWLSLSQGPGRDADVGLHRHWVDPTLPLSRAVIEPAHGVLVTSATLKDRRPESGATKAAGGLDDWTTAEVRTGALHLPEPPRRFSLASPFDYAALTRVLIVTDVRRDAPEEVAAAYRELFRAAGGGALGLFTAIRRLKAVHTRIAPVLEADGIPVYAQHADPMDPGTLIDVFRAEMDSCLLGTDAVRDGVDVPGRALRLVVFDRVPWPRPDILHRARKAAFGGTLYDDMLTRLKLKQAYGRLLRRADDHGVFVMLDAMTPTRLLTAFPDGVSVERVGLADAVARTREFLRPAK